jgi:hypothetical protein
VRGVRAPVHLAWSFCHARYKTNRGTPRHHQPTVRSAPHSAGNGTYPGAGARYQPPARIGTTTPPSRSPASLSVRRATASAAASSTASALWT